MAEFATSEEMFINNQTQRTEAVDQGCPEALCGPHVIKGFACRFANSEQNLPVSVTDVVS